MSKIKKAIIPVAGLGTRFLPASKSIPKEMLPIVDKPGLLYIVEEAAEAGIEQIILITGRNKNAIEDFFDISYELEKTLDERNQTHILKDLDSIRNNIQIVSVRQNKPLGLGHAVYCAHNLVSKEPFAVLLGDELMVGKKLATEQLIESFNQSGLSTVSIMEVPKDQVSKYGIIDSHNSKEGLHLVNSVIEKPSIENAPSSWALPGRYVFTNEIMEVLRETPPGTGGEIQLTDAINVLAKNKKLNALELECKRYDVGNKIGFLIANVDLAINHHEIGPEFKNYLNHMGKLI